MIKILTTTAFLISLFVCTFSNAANDLYFPMEDTDWEVISPSEAGWDPALLAEAVKLAGDRKSSGLLILQNGKIIAEQYWERPDASLRYRNSLQKFDLQNRPIEDVASVQKSITAILVGIAQTRGFLTLEDSVTSYVGSGWSNASLTQESAITIRHLLTMTSGLTSDLFFEEKPGGKWFYNTPAYHLLMPVVSAATGKTRDEITHEWLTKPLGMTNSFWVLRNSDSSENVFGFATTNRDLARVGLMIQGGGQWKDEVIFEDPNFLQEMLSPSQNLNPSYGYLWWLNGQTFSLGFSSDAVRSSGPIISEAPPDLIAMQGAQGRKLYLVPSLNLLITRLGESGSADGVTFNTAFWKALLKAKPKIENTNASFDSGSGVLTIPAVNVDKQSFYVEMTLNNSKTLDFVLSASFIQQKSHDPRAATFSLGNRILSIPIVDTVSNAYRVNLLLIKDTPPTFRVIATFGLG
ncbi:beta-lactamase family protein [Gammaproteobacteria bacterium]|nr:beta-lactamase family protein [Gammaproteobacteria bacterium]